MQSSDTLKVIRQAARRAPQWTAPIAELTLSFLLLILVLSGALLFPSREFSERALALFSHQQSLNGNLFGTLLLSAPADFVAYPRAHSVQLSWSAGQNGSNYEVRGMANGGSGDCSQVTFTSITSTLTTDYLDYDRSSPQGTWFCYQIQTTRGSWSSLQSNPLAAAQLGFVAASVQLINGGDTTTCGEAQYGVLEDLDCGDQIAVTFNQPVDIATGPASGNTVCADQSSGIIWLGSTGSGACTSSETVHLGRLIGGTIQNGNSRFAASYAWNKDNTALIVTLGTLVSGSTYPIVSGATWTFIPTASTGDLLSADGGFHICDNNADGDNCFPGNSWMSRSLQSRRSTTNTPTPTPTETPTPYVLVTATATLPLPTATSEATITPTYTSTPTTTPLPTDTFTSTPTSESPTEMPSGTPTGTPGCMPVLAGTSTPTPTFTPTPGNEPPISLPPCTPTPGYELPTATSMPAETFTPTPTGTSTPAEIYTPTPTVTPVPTDIVTPTATDEPTLTPFPTSTP